MANFAAGKGRIKINEWFFESKYFKAIEKPIVWSTNPLFKLRIFRKGSYTLIVTIDLINIGTWFQSELKKDLNNICDWTVHL